MPCWHSLYRVYISRGALFVRDCCSLPSPCVAAASPRRRAATWRRVSHRSRAFRRAHACQAVHRRQHDEHRRFTTCFPHAQRRSWRRAHGPVGSVPRAWARWAPLWKPWWSLTAHPAMVLFCLSLSRPLSLRSDSALFRPFLDFYYVYRVIKGPPARS